VFIKGFLGWGNRKGGLEAYGPDGRWGGEGKYADHGDLLGDALDRAGATEGHTLLVVATPRFTEEAADELGERIRALVDQWNREQSDEGQS
jgi:hypothetical protein